jgi:hypothetical protein
MADVQRRPFNSGVAVAREVVRARRRRTLVVLTLVALGTLVLALSRQSLNWLLGHIAVDAVIAWYLAMLIQIRQQHIQRVVGSVAEDRRFDREESKVRIVAN